MGRLLSIVKSASDECFVRHAGAKADVFDYFDVDRLGQCNETVHQVGPCAEEGPTSVHSFCGESDSELHE